MIEFKDYDDVISSFEKMPVIIKMDNNKKEGWLNVYPSMWSNIEWMDKAEAYVYHPTKEIAKQCQSSDIKYRIHVVLK